MSLILKSNIAYGGPVANLPPFLPVDLYKTMYSAYGLRQLSADYDGAAIRVRRSSDDTQQDIGFNGTFGLDTVALETFVGAGDGFVTKVYDQTGAGRHAVQATGTAQPKIAVSGETTVSAGVPSMLFDGATDWLDMALAAGAFSNTNQSHWMASLRSTKTSGTEAVFGASLSTTAVNLLFNVDLALTPARSFRSVSRRTAGDSGGAAGGTVAHGNVQRVIVGETNWLAGTASFRQDATEVGTVTLSSAAKSTSGNSQKMYFGTNLDKSAFFGGYLTELMIYNNGGADVLAGVEDNMLRHFSG